MEDRFSIVTVDPSCKRFLEEEVGGVFQEGGADTGGQLLQEERSQFASHCGEALLCRGVIASVHQSETAKYHNHRSYHNQMLLKIRQI